MADELKKMTPTAAASEYGLSKRGAENLVLGDHWAPIEKALENAWDKNNNPKGVINLGIAENSLMHDEISSYFQENYSINPQIHLSYGIGPRGSLRLRTALSSFFATHFHSFHTITPEQILPMSGVSALTDALTWCICGDGEGILIPQPLYTGFQVDVQMRSRGVIVPVGFKDVEGFAERGLDSVFDKEMNETALQRALEDSQRNGVPIRAVLITNPHNPLGKCYSVEALKAIASFCSRHKLHLILDEIYAYSVFQNPSSPDAIPFTSIVSLDLSTIIDSRLVHVLYGMSKDFCANGTRLGVLASRNEGLIGAMACLSVFSWPAYMIQDIWASMLENKAFLNLFLYENQRRLMESYLTATSFLDDHKIGYFRGSNAGVFIWVDLRPYFTSKDKTANLRKEAQIVSTCNKNGVFIGYGSNFFTEEIGWFRVTFTCSKEVLLEGLERIVKSLKEIG